MDKKRVGKNKEWRNKMENQNEQKEKEEGVFSKLWNKTVFPDLIKEKKEKREMEAQLRKEALAEAQDELKEIYKKQIIQKEKDRIQGKGKGSGMLKKLGDEFASMGDAAGKKDIGAMMGFGGGSNNNQQQNDGSVLSNDKINSMMSLGENKQQSNDNTGSIASDEKIKKMLGR